jgi:sec-independent protein translocase protein TatA
MIEGLFQPTHLILIAIVALIVLGPAKLGDLGGAMGRSVREFKENVDVPDRASASPSTPAITATTSAMLPPEQRLELRERMAATDGIHASDV